MAPAKAPARSRRTHSYSWSSDSSALRPAYQWPDHPDTTTTTTTTTTTSGRTSGDDTSDGAPDDHRLRTSPRADQFKGRGEVSEKSSHLAQKIILYDSDSCLTPRSRRTLRRTLSSDTEPWPSVKTPAKPPSLGTIYSPTHEILHPMQSLLLEKSMSLAGETKPLTAALPARRAMSADLDSRMSLGPAPKQAIKPNPNFKFETHVEEDDDDERATVKELETGTRPETAPESTASSNVVVIIVDAEKKLPKFAALDWAINVAAQPGDEIVVLGVLKHVSGPSGYKVVANTDPLVGVNQDVLQSEVKKTTALFEQKLTDSGRRAECHKKNVKLTVRIAPGARARTVVVRELAALKATYAVFDRKIVRGRRYYGKHLSCHAVRMRSNGRSIKTIFSMNVSPTTALITSSTTAMITSPTTASSSPTTPETPPAHFWRRFTHFRSSRNSNSRPAAATSPGSSGSTASSSPTTAIPADSLNLDSFMAEMQDFSISLDHRTPKAKTAAAAALQSCVVADAYSYKQGMDARRGIKHRPISVTIPPICAT